MKTQLDYLIEFWKSFSKHNKRFLSSAMATQIEQTIDNLEKLKRIEVKDAIGRIP